MGLSFSHGSARWSYSGFNRFRGILQGAVKSGYDNILYLVNHSDCDGELSVNELKVIVPRLQEIIDSGIFDESFYDKEQARLLIAGMKQAINNGEPLEFV